MQGVEINLVAQTCGEGVDGHLGVIAARLNRRSTRPCTRRRSGWKKAATRRVEPATASLLPPVSGDNSAWSRRIAPLKTATRTTVTRP